MAVKKRATDNEILSRLTKLSSKVGVSLTYTHKMFFLRLLRYADKKGDVSLYGISVALSVHDLAKELDFPLRTTTQCLNRLAMCGAIYRIDGTKTFPRSPTVTALEQTIYDKE